MLHLHRSERADLLVAALADVLAEPLDDPMAAEVISVHSRGIERWITQELATRLGTQTGRSDGVCANVAFPFPSRVVGEALAAAAGLGLEDDPWAPDRLVWPVLETVEERIGEPWLSPVARHLGRLDRHDGEHGDPRDQHEPDGGDDSRAGRRYGTARRIADLFDRYAVHRPGMIRAWRGGDDVDGQLAPIADEHRWQPRLWRAVRDRVDVASTAERLADAVAALRAGAVALDLPGRLSVFGLTAVPTTYVEVLAALAAHRDVHLFLLHPSPRLWSRVRDLLAGQPGDRALGPRERDPTRRAARHPILASWARDARELHVVVTSLGGADDGDHRPVPADTSTLLTRLQTAVRGDAPPPGPPPPGRPDTRPVLDPADRSVQVHACHGRTRQVEVLRDAVLHLLAAHHDLEPRDIVVMCPSIEDFAPLIEAVFGAEVAHGGAPAGGGTDDATPVAPPDLRVRLADRALLQTNPVLSVAAQLLAVADGRITASEVADLVNRSPVRRRFRFDDDDVQRIEGWVGGLEVRWGLDADHRAAHGLPGVDANTWRAGLDRLLLGVAMADEELRTVGDTVPFDDVEGTDVELAGRFAELIDRLAEAVRTLAAPQPVDAWRRAIVDAVDALADPGDRERWQRRQLTRVLGDVVDAATSDGRSCQVPLTLAEVRALLGPRLEGRPTRANHRTGDLTVSTLVPMRSVPHRVVCLLGMDDEAFPRRTVPDGDDLLEDQPHVGDRDARTEDRQLLLDAVLAAGEHLVVTYTGRDERTNEVRAPAVPIGELLDTIDRTVRSGSTDAHGAPLPARSHVVTEHPLQPFDERNFAPDALGVHGPWSFDPSELAGAEALRAPRAVRYGFLERPLDPPPDELLALDDLVAFLQHPVRAFLTRRLGVSLPDPAEGSSDGIPVELAGLAGWQVGQRLLDARLAGHDEERWAAVERRRGTLPPGELADEQLAELRATVDTVIEVATEVAGGTTGRTVELDLPLPDGRSLVGPLSGVVDGTLVTLTYSRLSPKQRMASWARLVAATVHDPEVAWRAVTVGRAETSKRRSRTASWSVQGPLGADPAGRRAAAGDLLARLLDLHDRGMREPLPLFCGTSAEVADRIATGGNLWDADGVWETRWYPAEDRDPAHVLVLGHDVAFEELLAAAPRDDECGPGWHGDHDPATSRMVRYALRLWAPLLGVGGLGPFDRVDHR